MNIPETFIHYVWEKGLAGQHFTLDTGDECRIVKPGKRGNRDGPDFENTEIIIGAQRMAGNSEIHLKSSDWFRHGHHTDPSYDKTILHIVLNNDAIICDSNGQLIPAIVLPEKEVENLYQKYAGKEVHRSSFLRCAVYFADIKTSSFMHQIEMLAIQRMRRKSAKVSELLAMNEYNWTETAWKTIAAVYGLIHNTEPMEWLSHTLTWKMLCRAGNVFSAEAVLLGQAGFLKQAYPTENGYMCALQQEYNHWQYKFSLVPIDETTWKYNPVRPSAMPEVRLAQLAALVSRSPDLFSEIISATGIKDFYRIFRAPVSGYWKNHCRPETKRKHFSTGKTGKSSVDVVVVNAIVPLLLSFSEHTGQQRYEQTAMDLIKKIAPEQNKIIDIFVRTAGIKVSNAFETQGLLELFSTLCSSNGCMTCPVMNELIRTPDHD